MLNVGLANAQLTPSTSLHLMFEFFKTNEAIVLWSAAFSLVTFLGTLLVIPIMVTKIPADYFSNTRRHRLPWARQHPLVRGILLTIKNIAGYAFVLMGIIMLVLPGQGLLTIVIGVILIDFPCKFRFERWLASRSPILRSINWIRKRAHRDPLLFDHEEEPLSCHEKTM
ncbi:MAG: PGPGW domain-containing protein [Pseudomonadota bacterium]